MTVHGVPADVARDVAALLDDVDPVATEPEAFLGARFDTGLAWLAFPEGLGGRGLDADLQAPVDAAFASAGAPDPFTRNPMAVGMVAPTLLHHGSDAQCQRYLRPMYAGEEIWCQLFSEPGAGSDLASLATRARRDGGDWLVRGEKVWTSLGHRARWGYLLARTDPDVAKHRGLTCFAVDMQAPGVDVRPLRQMTGDAEFNEVYLDDVRIPDHDRIGEPGNGWTVAITTLMSERSAIGGAVAQHASGPIDRLRALLREGPTDAVARDRVVQLWIDSELLQITAARAKAAVDAGTPGAEGSVAKLFGCELNQRSTNAIVDLQGAHSMLAGDDVDRFLRARANTIEGGTSEVMRNVLGERMLGLPPEPRADRGQTWAETIRSDGGTS